MKEIKNHKNIIFDYDGTLHNSIKIYAPAFKKAYTYLVQSEQAKVQLWDDREISKWLGYSSKDMWNSFMPHLAENEKIKCSKIIGSEMLKQIDNDRAVLYEGALDVLKYLKVKRYNLIFLSNCKVEYMNKHKDYFKLEQYFEDFYCTEQFNFIPKYQIFNAIRDRYKGDYIIVGDRLVDIEIASIHNQVSIGCKYGFGSKTELENADIHIDNIVELMEIL